MRHFLRVCFTVCMLMFGYSSGMGQVGITGVPFLQLNPTPEEFGMAGAFTALPSSSTYAAWYNPAQLGINPGYSLSLAATTHSEWLAQFDVGIHFDNYAARFSHSFTFLGKETTLGLSFYHLFFDLGEQIQTDESGNELGRYNSYDFTHTLSFGLGTRVFRGFNISAGFSYRYIKSKLGLGGVTTNGESLKAYVKENAYDFGIYSELNITDALNISWLKPADKLYYIISKIRGGYSLKNIGDEINYTDNPIYADPLPRFAHLGFSGTLGFDFKLKNVLLNLLLWT